MSDRPVEDEIMDEARRFGHSMARLMRMHAQANGWLEKRKVRREINLEMRRQRRTEQAERVHHKAWTAQMIHRYQIAAQARYERWTDPNTTIEQRRRDDAAAIRHIDDLRERITGNTRLTEVERGIALDCLESARVWPYKPARTPEMLARAPKVRGLDALRYRARLARETEWIQRRQLERATAKRELSVTTEQPESGQQRHIQPQGIEQRGARRDEPQHEEIRHTAIDRGTVAAETGRAQGVPSSAQLAEIEARIRKLADEQEKRDRKISVLQRSVDAITADRDNLRIALDSAEARIERLQNLNRGLSVERDKYRGERDQAVQKLAQRTQPRERYGSTERQATQSAGRGNRGASTGADAEQKQVPSWWQEAQDRAFEAMQAAADDRTSAVVTAKVRELSASNESPETMGRRFEDWWIKEGGQQQYEAEQRTRASITARRPDNALSPEQQAQQQDYEAMRTAFYDEQSAASESALRNIAAHAKTDRDLSDGPAVWDQFATWWAQDGGREQYRAEQRTRGGENTQAMPREHTPASPATNGHRPARNGIERSR
ncbi:hypothetical protein [Nocardia carnea]|uniref:hypothetical protein n=1 Tax=Nocardia carnea TaxID=37328 RepID=UPI002457C60C|nr:hypothetical protein [Nocardia carnea]